MANRRSVARSRGMPSKPDGNDEQRAETLCDLRPGGAGT